MNKMQISRKRWKTLKKNQPSGKSGPEDYNK